MKWLKTKNNQILDLNHVQSFWIEDVYGIKVFLQDKDKIDWNIAEFENKEEAISYINSIFEILVNL